MLLRHASGYLAAMIIQALSGLVLLALLTRLLSADQFGRYALALALLQIAGGPLFHWCRALVTRFLLSSERDGRRAALLATVRLGMLGTGAVAALLVAGIAAAGLISPDATTLLLAVLPTMLLQTAFQIRTDLHRAALRQARCAAMTAGQSLLGVALSLLLAVPAGLQAIGAVLGLALSCGLCLLLDRAEPPQAPIHRARPLPWRELRPMLGYSLPMTIITGLETLLQSGDRFIIAFLLGDAAVAAYAAPQTLAARSIANLCAATAAAGLPIVIARFERDGPRAARAALRQSAELMLAITLPATVALIALAGPIADVMIGPALRGAARVLLPLVALATLMNGLSNHYVAHGFQLARRTGTEILAILPAVGIGAALNLLLVPRYGVLGAGYALLAAQACYLAASLLLVRRCFPLPIPWARAAAVLAASLAGAAAAIALPLPEGLPGAVIGGLPIVGCAAAAILATDMAGIRAALRRGRA